MDGNYKPYDYLASSRRIANILDQPAGQFEETDSLPDRDKLTFTNGFYGQCSAIFVDIRGSSDLTRQYRRPRLAKLYRSFISEMVAVLNGNIYVREVNIVGDCVWATYKTPLQSDIDEVFAIAYHANTLIELLNEHLKKREYEELKVGIGVEFGRVLMIKAGYNGSGINDVVYMGDVVNRAAHLANQAGRGWNEQIWAGEVFYDNLNDHNSGLLRRKHEYGTGVVYVGNVVRTDMSDWISETFG